MITVDIQNPPPWVVHLQKSDAPETEPMTWPFQTREEAVAAYRVAVASGQFTRTLRLATRTRPAFTVTLASVWRGEITTETVTGEPHFRYVEEHIP